MEEKNTTKQNDIAEMRQAVLDAISDRGGLAVKKQDAETARANPEKQKERTEGSRSHSDKTENRSSDLNKKKITVKIKKRKKFGFVKYLLIILSVVLLFLSVFWIGICRYGWNGTVSKALLKFIPYPAAIVGNDLILYKDYSYSMKIVLNGQKFNNPKISSADQKDISTKVLERLITNKIIKNIALEYEVSVPDDDINNSLAEYANQFSSEEEFIKTVKEFYLWDVEDFKKKLVYPMLLQNSLNNYIIWSDEFNKDKISLADKILDELESDFSDEKFIELVRLHSEDFASVKNNGDLGWFEKGVMAKEFEDAAFSLRTGEISEVVRTQFGFHIIKVNGKKNNKIKARHILIKARGLEEVLQEKKEEVRIWKFVKF